MSTACADFTLRWDFRRKFSRVSNKILSNRTQPYLNANIVRILSSTQQCKTRRKSRPEELADKIDENEIIKVGLLFRRSAPFVMGNGIEFMNFHQDVVFSVSDWLDLNRFFVSGSWKFVEKSRAEEQLLFIIST